MAGVDARHEDATGAVDTHVRVASTGPPMIGGDEAAKFPKPAAASARASMTRSARDDAAVHKFLGSNLAGSRLHDVPAD